MPSSKSDLFKLAASKWPSMMNILGKSEDGNSIVTDPSDVDLYKELEKNLGDDDWAQLSCWSFHQSLSMLIKDCYSRGLYIVYPGDVTFSSFDTMMKNNLFHESWVKEREIYNSLP